MLSEMISGLCHQPYQPSDNFVCVGKNSKIKPRKSEHGRRFKIRFEKWKKWVQVYA